MSTKSTTSITIDSEILDKARKENINISQWVNNKLKEYLQNAGNLRIVNEVLMPDEYAILKQYREDKELAEKTKNTEAVANAEAKMIRVKLIHARLNELTAERTTMGKVDEMTEEMAFRVIKIRDEQKTLQKELRNLDA